MWLPKRPINGTVAKLWLKKQDVPLSASCKKAQDPAMKHWRRGSREKQLKDDAHQKTSKVEMSLEWSQIAHKTLMSLSCPPVPQRPQWENIREEVHSPRLALCLVIWTHINPMCFIDVYLCGLRKRKVKYFTHKKFNMSNCKWKYCFKFIYIYSHIHIYIYIFTIQWE